jgi:PAS domain S-box-containing protein
VTGPALSLQTGLPGTLIRGLGRRLSPTGEGLAAYRPRFRDWRFWAVQALVMVIAGLHDIFEHGVLPDIGILYWVPYLIFLVPIVYAGLNFGFAGALATSIWATLLVTPNWLLWHEGIERGGVMFQMVVVNVVAVIIGQRIDRERNARHRAETAESALRVSEARYRGLFQSSPAGVVVVDPSGDLIEANPAAASLFGKSPAVLRTMTLADVLGDRDAATILDAWSGTDADLPNLTVPRDDGDSLYLEPVLTHADDEAEVPAMQILWQDVTEQIRRQAGLKAYAAYVLRAQEEERQRIARDLHDDSVQALVLLCRKLDHLELTNKPMTDGLVLGLRDARSHTEEVVGRLRDYSRALRPPILEDLGLVTTIRRLLMDLTAETGAAGDLEVVGEEARLPGDLELGLYRIAQEALRNVSRHAGAGRVDVELRFAPERLTIADDGRGFFLPPDFTGLVASNHLGLVGMRERAEVLGGRLQIDATPGAGTRVETVIPVPAVLSA